MTSFAPFALLAGAALALPHLAAQDLLGVAWDGAVVHIDSYTGQVTPLGQGLPGQNALARAGDGTFWSTRRTTQGTFDLTTIDPATGAATVQFYAADVRALALGPGNQVFAIRNAFTSTSSDLLMRVDTAGGGLYIVGYTGFQDVQGLAMHQGVLYGWDVFAGLLVVDPSTGAAVDPFPGVGGPAYQQSLCSHPDGRLLLGGGNSNGPDQLFAVDPATGVATWIADLGAVSDVRGLEPLGGYAQPLGQACAASHGLPRLVVTGSLQGGGAVQVSSANHAANALGALLFGLSTTQHLGTPLPYALDPAFGTVGCALYTSIDVLVFGTSGPTAPAVLHFGFGLPPALQGTQFHLQHACFEPVAGGMAWSDARTVHVQ